MSRRLIVATPKILNTLFDKIGAVRKSCFKENRYTRLEQNLHNLLKRNMIKKTSIPYRLVDRGLVLISGISILCIDKRDIRNINCY